MIPVYLDYGYTEWLLKRLETVNKANEAGIPPERIPYSKTCKDCDFKTICLPDIINDGMELIDNEALKSMLDEMFEIEEYKTRYGFLKEEADEMAKMVGKDFICGTDYQVQIKKSETTRINTKAIPIEERGKYEVKSTMTRIEYIPLNK